MADNKLDVYFETEGCRHYIGPGVVKNGVVFFEVNELAEKLSFGTVGVFTVSTSSPRRPWEQNQLFESEE